MGGEIGAEIWKTRQGVLQRANQTESALLYINTELLTYVYEFFGNITLT